MPDLNSVLISRSPFTGAASATPIGRGLTVSDRDGLGLATVIVRKDKVAALAQRLQERFNIELPRGPRRATAGELSLAGTGAETWLATYERGDNAFAASLRETIGDLASVSDQSDGYAVLRVGGPKVRDILEKLFPIDFHPRMFKPGDVATTVTAHMGVTVWRVANGGDGAAAFEVVVFRSLAADFWRVLSDAAAAG